ncbi:hypothetical protein KLP28_13925 [Nocardioidaceae bacterium]|nr:hypothetical protein KLP28_13925 [Nocardioidaceae bacterium]
MSRNVVMLVPLLAALLALLIADTRHDYIVVGSFVAITAVVWVAWRVVDGIALRRQRRSLEQ